MSDARGPVEGELAIDPAWTTRILTEFIRTEVERTGRHSVVVGLSGGIDSAVAAYLAARALGRDSVLALMMPYRSSSPDSLADACRIVDELGIAGETVEISPMIDGFVGVTTGEEVGPLRLGNVMARLRMLLLFDRSARDGLPEQSLDALCALARAPHPLDAVVLGLRAERIVGRDHPGPSPVERAVWQRVARNRASPVVPGAAPRHGWSTSKVVASVVLHNSNS